MGLAPVVGSITRIEVLPAELLVGDFVQQPGPRGAVRVLELPHFMAIANTYRIVGMSRHIGHDVLYRVADRRLVVMRGVPMRHRDELVAAARRAYTGGDIA